MIRDRQEAREQKKQVEKEKAVKAEADREAMYLQRHKLKAEDRARATALAAKDTARRLEVVAKEAEEVLKRCEAAKERFQLKYDLKMSMLNATPEGFDEAERQRLQAQLDKARKVAKVARFKFETFNVTTGEQMEIMPVEE